MAKGDHRVGFCPQGCQFWPWVVNSEADRYCKKHGELFKEVVGLTSDGDEMRRAMRAVPGKNSEEKYYNARQHVARLLKRSV